MPPPGTEHFTPEMLRLIELVESNIHFLVRVVDSREQAIALKARFSLPIGTLNVRFGLQPANGKRKLLTREPHDR